MEVEVEEAVLDLVREHMRADAKAPGTYDAVYKDECMFCFGSSESPGGLYINLRTHQAFDEQHVDMDHERTGVVLYLHQQASKVGGAARSWRIQPFFLASASVGLGLALVLTLNHKPYPLDPQRVAVLCAPTRYIAWVCTEQLDLLTGAASVACWLGKANRQARWPLCAQVALSQEELWQQQQEGKPDKLAIGVEGGFQVDAIGVEGGWWMPFIGGWWRVDETGGWWMPFGGGWLPGGWWMPFLGGWCGGSGRPGGWCGG